MRLQTDNSSDPFRTISNVMYWDEYEQLETSLCCSQCSVGFFNCLIDKHWNRIRFHVWWARNSDPDWWRPWEFCSSLRSRRRAVPSDMQISELPAFSEAPRFVSLPVTVVSARDEVLGIAQSISADRHKTVSFADFLGGFLDLQTLWKCGTFLLIGLRQHSGRDIWTESERYNHKNNRRLYGSKSEWLK